MALADLNRSNDTPITTLKLASITPRDWPTLPAVVGSLTDANVNAGKPRYSGAGATADWVGGVVGDDVSVATAATPIVDQNNKAVADYAPRNQAGKAALMVPPGTLAVDIARARGWIAPYEPYAGHSSPPAAPVITSLSPNTAAAGVGGAMVVDIIGTGFTPWSTVLSGNYPIPVAYVSPTLLRIGQWPQNSVPGIVQVKVIDHNVTSAPSDFTFT